MKKTDEATIYEAHCDKCGLVASGPDEGSVKDAGKRHQAKKHPKAAKK